MQTRLVLAAILFAAPLTAADVIVVDAAGGGDFTTLTAAVAAAVDGDLILVRHGEYPEVAPVVIDNTALNIVAETPGGGGSARLRNELVVRNLSGGRHVILQNLFVEGAPGTPSLGATPAVTLINNSNHVRLQSMTLRGGKGVGNFDPDGGPGLWASNSASVAVAGSDIEAGDGQFSPSLTVKCGDGGAGIDFAGGQLSLIESDTEGGWGGGDVPGGWGLGGDGGSGLVAGDADLFLVNSWARGGEADLAFNAGDGGHGLELSSFGWVLNMGTMSFSGGQGGFSDDGPHGVDGQGVFDPFGAVIDVPGPAHDFHVDSPLREGESGTFSFGGEPADSIWLFLSLDLHMLPFVGYQGVLMLSPSGLLGPIVLGSPGDLSVPFVAPDLPLAVEHLDLHVQPAYPGPDGTKLGTARVLTLLDVAF